MKCRKVAFIVLISEEGDKGAEAELEETVAKRLSYLKYWKLEKHSVIEG